MGLHPVDCQAHAGCQDLSALKPSWLRNTRNCLQIFVARVTRSK